jgi:hydroxymethylglutaryl-CoA lyase
MRPFLTRFRCPLRRPCARSFSASSVAFADHARIVEVGPRDGLQNEKSTIPLQTKLELISRLAKTGITHMETGSFVPAKWVPQVSFKPPDAH